MKTGRSFLLLIFFLATPSYAAQLPNVAVLAMGQEDRVIPQVRGLHDGLEEAGYVNGKNITIQDIRAASARELHDLLNEVVRKDVDVIVTTSAKEATVAKQTTRRIPIIFVPSIDPVGMGFVKSRARPDGNLTGLSFTRGVEDNGKQLLVFKQVVPKLRRVITFYDRQITTNTSSKVLAALSRAAKDLRIDITLHPSLSPADAVRFFDRVPHKAMDGVFVICNATFRRMGRLAERAAKTSAPLFGCTTTQVADEGALMTYAPDIYYLGYRGAWYVDRILKGAKPRDLPVEAPSKFELVINLKTARQIGVTIPPEVLILADRVFQ